MNNSMKEFAKMFPNTAEGLGKFTDGYNYLMYPKLYLYYMKKTLNKMKPVPDKLVYPEGEAYKYVDQLVEANTRFVNPQLIRRETSIYHAKVLRPQEAKKILSLNVDINRPSLPESILPYPKARDFILKSPDRIVVVDCACRGAKEDGCQPRNVCMVIGEPFVSLVLENNKLDNPRLITQEEAIAIIDAEHERGHIHNAFFKDACADRFYAICNCCPCCCNSMTAYKFVGPAIFAKTGYTREVGDSCKGCGKCVERCPFGVVSLVDGKAVVDAEACVGCGKCEVVCENGAVILKRDPSKGDPLDVNVLLAEQNNSTK